MILLLSLGPKQQAV